MTRSSISPRRQHRPAKLKQALIAVKHCSIVLDDKRVLDEINFALHRGERWALVGSNGSGKTLFLKLLRGDMWPTPDGNESREYCFDGDKSDQPFGSREHIAYVGPERQDRYVRYEWNHSVEQIVATGLFDEDISRTKPNSRERRRVAKLLKRFRLSSLRRRGFLTLSYGQRRRTLLARAFAGEPSVLLLDEVFNGLDVTSAGIVRTALNRTRGVGSTWIVTTHRSQDVPNNATHFARMEEGKLRDVTNVRDTLAIGVSSPRAHPCTPRKSVDTRNPIIQLCNADLYRDYRLILRDVNWTIRRGEHWAIVGANGSGKSSLLTLLYGDLHPRLGGSIERDRVPFGTPIAEWKRRVGFVSPELQADYFLARDLEEVVISGRYSSVGLNGAPTTADRRAARYWLNFFALGEVAHRSPRAVSYGQMRRALLARAMSNDPELLLLDKLARNGVQLLMAVHERNDLPACISHELSIRPGKTVVSGARRQGAFTI